MVYKIKKKNNLKKKIYKNFKKLTLNKILSIFFFKNNPQILKLNPINISYIYIFQKFNYFMGVSFCQYNFFTGVIAHITLGLLNKIFFPESPQKKNYQLIKKLYVHLFSLVSESLKISLPNLCIVKDKSYLDITSTNTHFTIFKQLGRLKKKKRSLQRKVRKKVFTSTYGRIWYFNT